MSDIGGLTKKLEEDVNKADVWVNGPAGASYTAKDGVKVPTIRTLSEKAHIDTLAAASAAERAENAAERAEIGSINAYLTYQDLPTSSELGDIVQVTNDKNNDLNGYYVWSGDRWVYSKNQPVSGRDIKELKSILSTNDAPAAAVSFVDNEYAKNLIATLYANGVLDISGISLGLTKLLQGGGGISISDSNGFLPIELKPDGMNIFGLQVDPYRDDFLIKDENGFIVLYVGKNGIIGCSTGINKQIVKDNLSLSLDRQKKCDINHVLIYGQSLSRGAQALPAISTIQNFNNIMMASGVKSRPSDKDYEGRAFLPLAEKSTGSEGETPVSGCLNGLSRRAYNGGYGDDWLFLGSSTGQGGQTVQSLSEFGASGKFIDTINLIKDCKKIADEKDQSYSVWAMAWYQGENDYSSSSNDKDVYSYLERWLSSMWEPLKKEIVAITEQEFSPYLFSYQVAAHRRYGRDEMPIAVAQLRASRMCDDVVLVAPAYIFKTANDNLHLTNEASWLMGEYTSRAMFQTMISRSNKFRPLEPISVLFNDKEIIIKFHVPVGRLVIDDALCASYENAGFIIRDKDDAVIDDFISSIEIICNDTVSIKTNRTIPIDAKITYARGKPTDGKMSGPISGPRGNLRDEAGVVDIAVSPIGNSFALHNACVMFEYSMKDGI